MPNRFYKIEFEVAISAIGKLDPALPPIPKSCANRPNEDMLLSDKFGITEMVEVYLFSIRNEKRITMQNTKTNTRKRDLYCSLIFKKKQII